MENTENKNGSMNEAKLKEAAIVFGLPPPKPFQVPVTLPEYQNLIVCRAILDMLLDSANEHGCVDGTILRVAKNSRELYL